MLRPLGEGELLRRLGADDDAGTLRMPLRGTPMEFERSIPDSTTDAELVARSFREPLRRFIARRVARAADVDDLLQEVFVRVAERGDELGEVEHMRGWLHLVARNVIIDHYRSSRRGDAWEQAAVEETGVSQEAPGVVDDPSRELAGCLSPIIERLPEPYREAIALTELEGLTQAEAADRSGVSLSGMKSRVQRGREQLRTLVLACCDVSLDRRRGVADFEPRAGGCERDACGCGPR